MTTNLQRHSTEFDDVLNEYFATNILANGGGATVTTVTEPTEVPELLKDVRPATSAISLSLAPSDNMSKISTNTDTGTDFLEKLLNGDSTGVQNSTGNVDYSKVDKQLNQLLDKSGGVNSDNTPNKIQHIPNAGGGTMDEVKHYESLQRDREEEEDSWPNTSEVKPPEDDDDEEYENDFEDVDFPLRTEKDETTQFDPVPENPPTLTEEPTTTEATTVTASGPQIHGFDLSPIHTSQLGSSTKNTETAKSAEAAPDLPFQPSPLQSANFKLANQNFSEHPPSPKRVSITLPGGTGSTEDSNIKSSLPVRATKSSLERAKLSNLGETNQKSEKPLRRSKKYNGISSSGYGQKIVAAEKQSVRKSQTTDDELTRLKLKLHEMQAQYNTDLKNMETAQQNDMMTLQRENFMLKAKQEQVEQFSDQGVIDALNKENSKLRDEKVLEKKAMSQQTDQMTKENLKLKQALVIIEEERDNLKTANKHLRSPGSKIPRTPTKLSSKIPTVTKKTPRKVIEEPEKENLPLTATITLPQQPTEQPMNSTLLPAFLALERQLTITQNQLDQSRKEIATGNVELAKRQNENNKLEWELEKIKQKLTDLTSEMGQRMTVDSHQQILNAFKEQSSIEKNKLETQLVTTRQQIKTLQEKITLHEQHRLQIDKDAKTVVRRGVEISKLKQELASLHQRLEAALSKKPQHEQAKINSLPAATSVLEKRISQLEFELKDRDDCINKLLRQNSVGGNQAEIHHSIDDHSQSTEQIQILSSQLTIAHKEIEELRGRLTKHSGHAELQTRYKKQILSLEEKLISESQKVTVLNRLLLEEKTKIKHIQTGQQEDQVTQAELKHLLIESNEKLQSALTRENKLRITNQENLQELEAFRTQDINGVNTILFEKLNQTRTRIAELEQAHAERLDIIARLQVTTAGGGSEHLMIPTTDPEIVTQCQTELGDLMGIVGQLHQQIRSEMD